MTADEDPEIDPQDGAPSPVGAPETPEESASARRLAELFAPLTRIDEPRSEVHDASSAQRLAALFEGQSSASPRAREAKPDFSSESDSVLSPESATASVRQPVIVAGTLAEHEQDIPDAGAPVSALLEGLPEPKPEDAVLPPAGAALATSALPSAARTDSEAIADADAEAEAEDPLAWFEHLVEERTDTAEEADLGGWLGMAAATLAEPTRVLPQAATGPSMTSVPAQRRGIRAWSSRVRWSVVVSIVLLIGVVAGAFAIAQTVAADNLAARQLAAAVDDLEAAEESATQPQSVLDAAVAQYEDTVESARATADSAAPPLAAIVGMAAQPALDASNAALAALNVQLAESALDELPEPYERGDVDMSDIDEVTDATQTAENHEELITAATRDVGTAQAALQEKLDALRAAQVTLGGSLPETAVLIVGENKRALKSFRDAVIAASVAVPAAQNAGGSGDAEILAYAAAVTALRDDQTRAENGVRPVTPPTTGASRTPVPQPAPVPEPVPEPEPVPPPEPVPTPDPSPEPSP